MDCFFFFISESNVVKSYRLNTLQSKSVIAMLIPPAIIAVKKLLIKRSKMFEIKCPVKLEMIVTIVYFESIGTRLNSKCGNFFLIILKLSRVIVAIDRKNAIIIELIPTSGVSAIKLTNRTTEPIM